MFTIDTYNLDEIGRSGSGTINCRVEGFWSSSVMTLYVRREYSQSLWSVTLTHSSGGRDTKEIADDLMAAKRFAAAMVAMADLGVLIRGESEYLERMFQERRAEERAEFEAAVARDLAIAEADTPLGRTVATVLVKRMAETGLMVKMFVRGTDKPVPVTVERRAKTKFYLCGSVIAKAALIEKLAASSHRTDYA